MKGNRILFIALSLLLICAMTVNLTGCAVEVQAKNLMEGIKPNEVSFSKDLSSQNATITDFAVRLFRASEEEGANTLISPLSVLCALSMTANGAREDTLREMEEVLGLTTDELNLYLYNYMRTLPQGDNYKLSLANSIWFTEDDRFTVNEDFLQTNADYYGADIYQAPFDSQTCKDINSWVKDKTAGMIPEILDSLSPDSVMCLINALAFDAQWATVYEKHQVQSGIFTKENGTKQLVDFMYGEDHSYLEDEKAIGFMKPYKGGKYAFVAMLPKEGITVSEYIASLNGESLHNLLANPFHTTVYTSIPKFETEYHTEMSRILTAMGMPKAFDVSKADLHGLGTSDAGNIYISQVLHKTFISVGEKGTKAGAATAVIAADGGMIEAEKPKEIYLDRPFVYMLVDCENSIPFFMGTMMSHGEEEASVTYDKPASYLYPEEEESITYAKPVIYLYPEEKTEVSVKLNLNGQLTCTYPAYNSGWTVTATPEGILTDEKGQTYNYLYWEGEADTVWDLSEGFCIRGEDTAPFLETALSSLGLNRREANEFIVYWLPFMEQNPYNIISFQTDLYTESAPLDISPAPDTLIRVHMAWKASDHFVDLPEQALTAPNRTGFTVIEWGGTQVK